MKAVCGLEGTKYGGLRNVRPPIIDLLYSFFEVKPRVSKEKYDTRDKNLSTVLANSSNHSRARRHNLECKPATATRSQYTSYSVPQNQTLRDLKYILK